MLACRVPVVRQGYVNFSSTHKITLIVNILIFWGVLFFFFFFFAKQWPGFAYNTFENVVSLTTIKILTIGTPKIIPVFVSKCEQFALQRTNADEMANSVDPNQTAPSGAV